MSSTRRATALPFRRISEMPSWIRAAASTRARWTIGPVTVTLTERTMKKREPSRAQATPARIASAASAKKAARHRVRSRPRRAEARPPEGPGRRGADRTTGAWSGGACPRAGVPATSAVPRRGRGQVVTRLRAKRFDDDRPERCHVTGAHGEHEPARAGGGGRGGRHTAAVGHETAAPARHRIGHQPPGDARLGILPRRVHIEHDRLIGQPERGTELLREDPGAAEKMRLEDGDNPPARTDLAGRAQVGR